MAVTFVKNIGTVGVVDPDGIGGSSTFIIPAGGVPEGNTLFLALSASMGLGLYTIVDGASGDGSALNTWVVDRAGGAPPTELWRCSVTQAYRAGDTIELIHPGIGSPHGFAAACREYAGIQPASPLDHAVAANGYSPLPSATTAATTQAEEIVIGAVGWDTYDSILHATFTKDAFIDAQYDSVTEAGGAGAQYDASVSLTHQVVSEIGVQTVSGGLGNSRAWCVLVGTYKAATSTGADPAAVDGNFFLLM